MVTYHLENVQKKYEESPYTTFVPNRQLIDQLNKGDRVKLNFVTVSEGGSYCGEVMWVVITMRRWNDFVGTLVNQPQKIRGLALGQEITFGAEHICETEYVDLNLLQLKLVYNYHNVIVSKDVLNNKEFNLMVRHKPKSNLESGWVVISGYEDKEYLKEKANFEEVTPGVILNIDDSVLELMGTPRLCAYIRIYNGTFYPIDFADVDPIVYS
jgi:hypothetical protein